MLVCQVCGRTAPESDGDAVITWAMDRDGERVRWTCPRCIAENVRALEAKLEPEWW